MSKARKAREDAAEVEILDVRPRQGPSGKPRRKPLDREPAETRSDSMPDRETKPKVTSKAPTRRKPSEAELAETRSSATPERKTKPRTAVKAPTRRKRSEPTQSANGAAPARRAKAPTDANETEIVNVRRRQDRSVETRRKILEGALVEFATVGFEGATTRSIAHRAEVPHGLVIYHFETKLGAWQAVIERALADLHEQWERVAEGLRGSDPETILRASYRNFIEFTATRPEHTWIFSHEVSAQTERLHWLLEQIRGRDLEAALDLIRQLQAAGRYVQGDPAHLHFLFVGAASRVFSFAPEIEHYVGVSPFDQAFIDRHVELCLGLFFRGSQDPAEVRPNSRPKRGRSTHGK